MITATDPNPSQSGCSNHFPLQCYSSSSAIWILRWTAIRYAADVPVHRFNQQVCCIRKLRSVVLLRSTRSWFSSAIFEPEELHSHLLNYSSPPFPLSCLHERHYSINHDRWFCTFVFSLRILTTFTTWLSILKTTTPPSVTHYADGETITTCLACGIRDEMDGRLRLIWIRDSIHLIQQRKKPCHEPKAGMV